jgi:hypothetical protein
MDSSSDEGLCLLSFLPSTGIWSARFLPGDEILYLGGSHYGSPMDDAAGPPSDTPGVGTSDVGSTVTREAAHGDSSAAAAAAQANLGAAAGDKDGDKSNVDVAKLAVAAIGVITAAAGLIGGFTGGIARVARNGPSELPWDVFWVFAAALAALIAALIPPSDSLPKPPRARGRIRRALRPGRSVTSSAKPRPSRHWRAVARSFLLVVSLVLFATASIRVASALSHSLAKPDRPIINAMWVSMDGGWTLKGSVTASGLKTTDKMTVMVGRIIVTRNDVPSIVQVTPGAKEKPSITPASHFAYYAGGVYKQVVGADLNGNAIINIQVPLPKNYDGLQISANLGDSRDVQSRIKSSTRRSSHAFY